MTATLPARKPRTRQAVRRPDKNYVECPVCGVPTGTFENAGCSSTLFRAASGPEDGMRCSQHARSLELRARQSRAAIAWITAEDVHSQLVHE